jgi:DNA-binding NarL/FixJ family response regulator
MKKSIRVALVDDHKVVRRGVANLLNKEAGIKVEFDVSNGSELLAELKNHKIDVVLLDINMPIMNGKQTLLALKVHHPELKVIMLSMYEEEAIIQEYLELGASGFLAKNCSIDETVDAIFNVYYEGKQNLIQNLADATEGISSDKIELDERESIVLNLICEGVTSDEISQHICRSKKTVDLIRTRLMQKFEASNVIDLVRKSILMGYYVPKITD